MRSQRPKRGSRNQILSAIPEDGSGEFELWHRNQQLSPLLRLPPEVRNRIYEFVLSVGLISVNWKPWQPSRRIEEGRKNHATSRIPGGFYCRQLGATQNPWREIINDAAGVERRGMTLLSPVCRQLYRETSLLPFQLNAWFFESTCVMERYVFRERRLPLAQRRAIHTLYVNSRLTKAMEKFFGGLKVVMWNVPGTEYKPRRQVVDRQFDAVPTRSRPRGTDMQLFNPN